MDKKKYIKILTILLLWLFSGLFIIFVVPRLLAFFSPFVVGFLLSLLALPIVRFLEKRMKITRKFGTMITIIAVIALVVLMGYGIIVALSAGIRSFIAYLPTLYDSATIEINQAAASLEQLLRKIPIFKNLEIDSIIGKLSELLSKYTSDYKLPVMDAIGGIVTSIPDVLVGIVTGFLATYYFIADNEKIRGFFRNHTSAGIQRTFTQIYNHILLTVGGYFKAQFKIMFIIYAVVFVGLVILKVKYAWLIGFGIAFLDMLPVFGTGTILCPWAVIKIFSGNIRTAIGMLVLYVITLLLHQLIQPKLVGDTVGMDTFLTVIFMFIGYKLKGVFGMIIFIPIGMLLVFFYKDGFFDSLIWCVREIAKDIDRLRKIE